MAETIKNNSNLRLARMLGKRILSIAVILFWASASAMSQTISKESEVPKEMVVAQMNYCINALTNIIHNKSMTVLEHESDMIINNLTMEQMIGLPDIAEFRTDLLDGVGRFQITEEERALTRRILSIKRDNMKWRALSNALNPTMLLVGNAGRGMSYQLAFQALLATARSAIEYKTLQGEQSIEELQAMWDLRKSDMQTILGLRKEALNVVFRLYQQYHLNESDRLTEATANQFNTYVSEPDARKRIRLLEDHRETYGAMADYYYHLGMAYVDADEYGKAQPLLDKYLELYRQSPIFRYDEKSGCVALTKLLYEKGMTRAEKETLIREALENLPNNGAAVMQCAMVYLAELNAPGKAYDLLRSGIDNPGMTDRDAIIMMACNFLGDMAKYPVIYSAVCEAIEKCSSIGLDSYIVSETGKATNAWPAIEAAIAFKDEAGSSWYTFGFGEASLEDEFRIQIPRRTRFRLNEIEVYKERHDSLKVTIAKQKVSYTTGISEKEIEEVDCFKKNENLKYLFMTEIDEGVFQVKPNLDYGKIEKESFPRMSEFMLSENDKEDIIDFCKEHEDERGFVELTCENADGEKVEEAKERYALVFTGDTLGYEPHHSPAQRGEYVRFVLREADATVMYKLDLTEKKLVPYMYEVRGTRVFYEDGYKMEYEAEWPEIVPEEAGEEEEKSWWDKATEKLDSLKSKVGL